MTIADPISFGIGLETSNRRTCGDPPPAYRRFAAFNAAYAQSTTGAPRPHGRDTLFGNDT